MSTASYNTVTPVSTLIWMRKCPVSGRRKRPPSQAVARWAIALAVPDVARDVVLCLGILDDEFAAAAAASAAQ